MNPKLNTWKSGLVLLSLFFLGPTVGAHSWAEQLTVIAPNGTFIGSPGYPRGYVPRSAPGFADPKMMYLVPQVLQPSDLLCKETQRKQVQSDGSPRLQASAGAAIAVRYQENGHVTLPENTPGKPLNRGTVYVYGTAEPKEDEKFMDVHNVWNKEGTGGDKRGVLLSVGDYDDGRCYQVNDKTISTKRQSEFSHTTEDPMGADLWCQQDIRLPSNAPSGKPYTLYWVWDWPTDSSVAPPNGKPEIYTTCMDVDLVASAGTQSYAAASYIHDQSLNRAAIPSQFAEIFGSGASPGPAPSSSKAAPSMAPSSSGPAPAPAPSLSKALTSMAPSSSKFAPAPAPNSSNAAVSLKTSKFESSPTKVPAVSQGVATVTSFVTMMKTILPSSYTASTGPN
ncbi:hypothetical protein BDV29DRAFT_158435 [Aspergillus leporis]|uniref:DUF7492 domain-containing protein n=1 Tax=Aspergillus leporis TaxID=41062 RepID=A0A5N5WXZ6_9EURO|nr:hypothetical protein BDV29DRAFT_158435 [Aspergillus leporis]